LDIIKENNKSKGFKNLISLILSENYFILVIIFILTLIIAAIFVPRVFQVMNILNVLRLASIVGLVAIGETFVILTGEIDISVGSILTLSLVVGGFFLKFGTGPAIVGTLAAGLILGMINGFAVGKGKLTSLIMTLGTLSIYAGMSFIISRGQPRYLYGFDFYLELGKGYFLGIPIPAAIFIFFTIICFVFLNLTKTGRYFYYIGANETAAKCSGIRIDRIKILAFSLSGLFASMAGPFIAAQTNRIGPSVGVGYEMSAIAIVVLGGTSIAGGKGHIIGTFVGAITYGIFLNMLALSGVGTYMEALLRGLLLIVAVIIFQNIRRKG